MFASAVKKIESFSEKLAKSRADDIFFVRGRDESGKPTWYYVLVDHDKRDFFRRMSGVESLKLTDFGQILHSGYGVQPPAAIRKTMLDEYGFSEA